MTAQNHRNEAATGYAPEKQTEFQEPRKDLAVRFAAGQMTESEKTDYAFGKNRLDNLNQWDDISAWQATDALSDRGNLGHCETMQLRDAMERLLKNGERELTSHGASEAAITDLRKMAAQRLLESSGHMPPPELATRDESTTARWRELTDNIGVDQPEKASSWLKIPEAIKAVEDTAELFNRAGKFPDGYSLEDVVSHYSNDETKNREPGCNWISPQRMSLQAPMAQQVNYAKDRLNATLKNPLYEGEMTPAEFCRGMMGPHLDPELAGRFDQFDLKDDEYGKGRYREDDATRALTGDTADPHSHLSTTYCRSLRDTLSVSHMTEAAENGNVGSFGMKLHDAAKGMQKLADYSKNVLEHPMCQPDWERRDPTGYEPMVRWNEGIQANWQEVLTMTDGLQDLSALELGLRRMEIHTSMNYQSLYEQDDKTDPRNVAFTEAAMDILSAGNCLDLIRYEEGRKAEASRVYQEIIAPAKFLQERGQASPAVAAMLEEYSNATKNIPVDQSKDQERYAGIAQEVRNELAQLGITEEAAAELTADHKRIALLDRAMRAAAHADFNLSSIHHNAGERRQAG